MKKLNKKHFENDGRIYYIGGEEGYSSLEIFQSKHGALDYCFLFNGIIIYSCGTLRTAKKKLNELIKKYELFPGKIDENQIIQYDHEARVNEAIEMGIKELTIYEDNLQVHNVGYVKYLSENFETEVKGTSIKVFLQRKLK